MNNIKVGLVEDQFLFREGIKAILNSMQGIEVMFEAADGYSVLEKLNSTPTLPNVMLVDLSLPPNGQKEYSGLNVTHDLIVHYPTIKILILSVHEDENFITQLIECGAHGYLVKDSDPKEVQEAIIAVHHKGSYINQRTLIALQHNMGRRIKSTHLRDKITKREKEILQLICQQYTAEEIGEKLFISERTVNGHRNHLLQKTKSKNVTGLVMYAIKNNIVNLI
ncbi:MAG: response regulator transcription factor [Pelobium sp.]